MSLPNERVALAVRNLVDEAEEQVPVADLADRNQQSNDKGGGQNEQTPRQRRDMDPRRSARHRGQCQHASRSLDRTPPEATAGRATRAAMPVCRSEPE